MKPRIIWDTRRGRNRGGTDTKGTATTKIKQRQEAVDLCPVSKLMIVSILFSNFTNINVKLHNNKQQNKKYHILHLFKWSIIKLPIKYIENK